MAENARCLAITTVREPGTSLSTLARAASRKRIGVLTLHEEGGYRHLGQLCPQVVRRRGEKILASHSLG